MAKKVKTKNNKKEDLKLKTNNKKVEKSKDKADEKNEFFRLIKIILIVTAIFGVFDVVTIVVTNKAEKAKVSEETSEEKAEKTEIQYKNIMIGTMLNHTGTYYVLIQEADEIRSDHYDTLVTAVSSNPDSPDIYKANLTDSFNKKYLSKEENYYVDDISKFRVKGTTLIKVVDGKVDAAFDNYDAIKNKLTELS